MKAAEFRVTANASRAASSQLAFFNTMMAAKTAVKNTPRNTDVSAANKTVEASDRYKNKKFE